MRAYIQSTKRGIPKSNNFYVADQGFREMGIETSPFSGLDDIAESTPDEIIVGGLGAVTEKLNAWGIEIPSLNYPKELEHYLGRRVWSTTIDQILDDIENRPVFVKPVREKRFTGMVLRSAHDCPRLSYCESNEPVICSDVVEFLTEWRVFVRYGQILDVRPYYGNWKNHFAPSVIEQAVRDYQSAPAGYAMDFGITDKGQTLLVEVNDGFSIGCYGLAAISYAKLLSARWAELTGIHDECDVMFDGYEWKKMKQTQIAEETT